MKTLYKIVLLLLIPVFFISCEEGDVFVGTPAGTDLQFITLKGTVATTESNVVSGQVIPITVTIPQSFPVETKVQVIAFLPNTNKRSTKSVIFPAGETTVDSEMTVPGAEQSDLPFHMNLEIYLAAITTGDDVDTFGFPGKQYSLTSDKITLDFSDTTIPAQNVNRLLIRFDFENYNNGNPASNNLNLSFRKNGVITPIANNNQQATAAYFGSLTATARYENVNFNNAIAEDGTYTIYAFAQKLIASPSDVDYRFVIRFPAGKTRVFAGTLPGLTLGNAASSIPVLQIVKSTDGNGVAQYAITQL